MSGEAYGLSFTPRNIVKGFEVSGIYPYNRDIFSDEDFLCSFVTDRPNRIQSSVENESGEPEVSSNAEQPFVDVTSPSRPDPIIQPVSNAKEQNENADQILPRMPRTPEKTTNITPESLRPFAKASARKTVQRGRKPGKTRILVPEKQAILEEALKRKKKTRKTKEES